MARIKFGALVESIRGSIGGTTFQSSAYGFTVKAKSNIAKPNSIRQQQRKISMQSISRAWRSLTSANRLSWDVYASLFVVPSKLNKDSNLNGYNYFLKYNLLLFPEGIPSILADPTVSTSSYLADEVTLFSNEVDTFNFNNSWVSDTASLTTLIYMTSPLLDSRKMPRQTPLFIKKQLPTASADPDYEIGVNVYTEYFNLFGFIPSTGDLIGVRLVIINSSSGFFLEIPTVVLTVD